MQLTQVAVGSCLPGEAARPYALVAVEKDVSVRRRLEQESRAAQYEVILSLAKLAEYRDPELARALLSKIAATVRFGTVIRPMFKLIQEQLGVLSTTMQESMTGIRVVKAFARERYEGEKFRREAAALFADSYRSGRIQALSSGGSLYWNPWSGVQSIPGMP